ncbi:Mariner Transposase [Phytophthora megakarya]|uniref:Mariner Transposase n=1 Tax=Phytophthora megakarya TaxID=4795 RepID=A0A225UWN5_9STRA|nr:Mariner Transposase [Phytophthora megakarya]
MAGSQHQANKDLPSETKLSIATYLLEQSTNLKVPRSHIIQAAELFKCSNSSVKRVWRATVTHRKNCSGLPNFKSKRVGRCGKTKKLTDIATKVAALPWRKRRPMRSIAKAIQVSPASVHRSVVAGEIVRHTNSINPHLTESNKTSRCCI